MIQQGSVHNVYEFIEQIKIADNYQLWKARQVKINAIVMIKVVTKSMIDNDKFGEEIKVHSMINYPFVARFYHYFEEDELSFIVMEYLSDKNLEEYITNKKDIKEEQVRIWFSEMILTLMHLDSSLQVCHTYLEASNFSLSNNGHLKLFDFENCQFLDASMNTKVMKCHPFYLSPEEIRNETNPFTSTVWRCGIILYRMLTGDFPFEDDSKSELFTSILSMKPIIPSQISDDATSLLKRMLTKDPYERITLEEIVEHPFFAKIQVNIPQPTDSHIKSDIIKQLEGSGYNKATVIADLKAKLFTEKTAAYKILLIEGIYGDDSEISTGSDDAPVPKSQSAAQFQKITQPKNMLINKMKLRPIVSGRSIPIIPQKKFRRANSCKTVMDYFYQKDKL